MSFSDWARRHLADEDPQPEPASPPPFTMGERVIASPEVMRLPTGERRGEVIGVDFTTDPDDPYGPWVITVLNDATGLKMAFHAAELTREQDGQTMPPHPHEDDYEPYTGGGEVPALPKRDTPIYDDVEASAMAADGLAAEVEAYLASISGGAS